MKETLNWYEINVGDEGHTLEYTITPELIDNFAVATGDDHEWYMKDSPFGGRIAHSTINSLDYFAIIFLKWGKEWTGLHARHETEVKAPLKLGQKVIVKGKIVGKYEKRGRNYLELEYITRDMDGNELVRNKITTTVDD